MILTRVKMHNLFYLLIPLMCVLMMSTTQDFQVIQFDLYHETALSVSTIKNKTKTDNEGQAILICLNTLWSKVLQLTFLVLQWIQRSLATRHSLSPAIPDPQKAKYDSFPSPLTEQSYQTIRIYPIISGGLKHVQRFF